MASISSHGFRHLSTTRCSFQFHFHKLRTSTSLAASPSSTISHDDSERAEQHEPPTSNGFSKQSQPYFPKRGQTLELVCESLAFKGKGLCKVADTGFVVLCDRVFPGERFVGRVTRRKGNYAEVSFISFFWVEGGGGLIWVMNSCFSAWIYIVIARLRKLTPGRWICTLKMHFRRVKY